MLRLLLEAQTVQNFSLNEVVSAAGAAVMAVGASAGLGDSWPSRAEGVDGDAGTSAGAGGGGG